MSDVDRHGPRLSAAAFFGLRGLIGDQTGIVLNDGKRNFVAARLQRRLRELRLASYDDYYAYVKTQHGEFEHLINAITTNKTSFFREPHHFEMLARDMVPRLVARAEATGSRRVRIWSAGCSSGEEAFSIAMTLHANLPEPERWDLRVLASDIDTEVLGCAGAGVYSAAAVETIAPHLRRSYFEDRGDGTFRAAQVLRDLVIFRHINLNASYWPIRTCFDAIFCRNVVIYFDQKTQAILFRRFASLLNPGAPLVLGHSETLHWMSDLYRQRSGTMYHLRRDADLVQSARRITVGQVFATKRPTAIRTLLGSCMAACLYDPVAKVGGMNHFLLPAGPNDEPSSARFGAHAMELLINAIMRQGGQRSRLEAKIFGGAHVLDTAGGGKVSEKNVAFLRAFLETENIPLRAQMVGGNAPLDVCMFSDTGKVWARRLRHCALRPIADAESRFAHKHVEPPEAGIVWF